MVLCIDEFVLDGGESGKRAFSTYSIVMLTAVKGEGTSVVVFIVAVHVEMSFVQGGGGSKS